VGVNLAARRVPEEPLNRIYLDHAATSPLLPAARDAMAKWAGEGANPSSLHAEGRLAKQALDEARETVADALGCLFAEVVFTSSGTEAANLAIVGSALANEDQRRQRVLFSAAEHHAVLETAPLLTRLGYEVQILPVDRYAAVRLDALEDALGDDVLLVAAMHANNEVGTFNPISQIVEMAHRCGALVFCDAVQTFSRDTGADLVAVSAHKIGGPRGVGALTVRAGVKLKPTIAGGGQERELRGGTENVAGIAGFAAAVANQPPDRRQLVRDAFRRALSEPAEWTTLDGPHAVLPGHAHLRAKGCSAESMLIVLDRMGVSASSGAACSSGSIEPSHVLLACGYSESEAREALRFTFGKSTTIEEAEEAAVRVSAAIRQVRS